MTQTTKVLSWDFLMKNIQNVVRHESGYRFVGNSAECDAHMKALENCEWDGLKDYDILNLNGQPDCVKPFIKEYLEYCDTHGWTTFPQFYPIYVAGKGVN
jgi:hypothetical protein